ncbi:hypothetical protein HN51_028081, partial [Arachis hypogaea]
PDLAQKIGATTALEVRVTRIPYVCRDPRWGWCYKSYSEDLKIVKKTMSSEDCLGWAARDASGHLSPYKFNCRNCFLLFTLTSSSSRASSLSPYAYGFHRFFGSSSNHSKHHSLHFAVP